MAPSSRPTLERKRRLPHGVAALVIAAAGFGCSGSESDTPGQPTAAGSGAAGGAGAAGESNSGAGGESGSGGASGGSGGEAQAGAGGRTFEDIAADLRTAIAEHPTDVPFTLLLGNEGGTFFEGSKGDSTATTSYESASTSKWVSAAVILSLVERGYLTLDARPQDFITWWTDDASDPRSQVTLRQLLSFTSGVQPPPPDMDALCISVPLGSFENCVQNVYEAAGASALTPGEEFIYGQNHLQVAGLMAIEAREVTGFGEIFAEFQELTGLFPSGAFDLPSASKPRLAGGMHWTGEEYMGFLHALYSGELLGSELREQMFTDHTPVSEVAITESPVERGLGLAWHYGLGNWRECPFPDWEAECEPVGRVSSPGLYGAYPFIDFGRGFYGILARQGSGGTFRDGVQVYTDLEPLILELVAAAL